MNKLLVFTENYARGGGNRYMIDLVNALLNDYEDVFITSNAGGVYPEDLSRLYRPVAQCDVNLLTRSSISSLFRSLPFMTRRMLALPLVILEPLFLLYNIGIFVRLIRNIKPTHILSCNGGYPAAQACLAMVVAARLSRVPVVLSIVSMPTKRRTVTWPYEKLVDKITWSATNIVVTNAVAVASALCNQREARAEKLKVIYNGLEDRPPRIADKVNDGKLVIGCIARMDVSKGVLFLFEAFSSLAKDRPDLQLVLAGHGDASEELVARTEALGLQNQVQLLGHYEGDVCALLDTFDIYVFPSLWEGFPYSIIEALRSGCVIVTTKVGGIPEVVTDDVEGVLIEPGTTDEIIRTLEELMSNRDMRQALAKNARRKFEQELMLSKMQLRVREAFAELPGRK